MKTLSATDLAIAIAVKSGTLRLEDGVSRFGAAFVAISDDVGLIEIAASRAEAEARIAAIKAQAA